MTDAAAYGRRRPRFIMIAADLSRYRVIAALPAQRNDVLCVPANGGLKV